MMIRLYVMIFGFCWFISTSGYQVTKLSIGRTRESRFLLHSIFRNGERRRSIPVSSTKDLQANKSPTIPVNPLSVDAIVNKVVNEANCIVKSITINKDKYNIIIAKGIRQDGNMALTEDTWNSPTSDEITSIHQKIYQSIEQIPVLEPILVSNQFLISSPGIPDKLTNDRDFISFKGFPVVVRLTELFRKKKEYQGTLLGRDENYVSISLKGRKVDLPRHIIEEVFLPTTGFEEGEDPNLL